MVLCVLCTLCHLSDAKEQCKGQTDKQTERTGQFCGGLQFCPMMGGGGFIVLPPANAGRIPYILLGGKLLYRESDIERLLMEGYRPAAVRT